jgi:hypothetical protein
MKLVYSRIQAFLTSVARTNAPLEKALVNEQAIHE